MKALEFKQSCYVTVSKRYTATCFRPDSLVSYLEQAVWGKDVDTDFGRIVKIGTDWTEEGLNQLKDVINQYIRKYSYANQVKMAKPTGLTKWEDHQVLWSPDDCIQLEVGDRMDIFRNQGYRDAEVLKQVGGEALIVYEMPNGRRFTNIINLYKYERYKQWGCAHLQLTYRAISEKQIRSSKKWSVDYLDQYL